MNRHAEWSDLNRLASNEFQTEGELELNQSSPKDFRLRLGISKRESVRIKVGKISQVAVTPDIFVFTSSGN